MKTRRIGGTGTVAVEHTIENKNLQDFADFGRDCFYQAAGLHTIIEIEGRTGKKNEPDPTQLFTFTGKQIIEMAEMFDFMSNHMVNISDDTTPTEDIHKENFTISSEILNRRKSTTSRKDTNEH